MSEGLKSIDELKLEKAIAENERLKKEHEALKKRNEQLKEELAAALKANYEGAEDE